MSQTKEIQVFFPQGWAFFTKDPHEEQIIIFQKKEDKYIRLNIKNNANDFGVSRKNRLKQLQILSISNQIDSAEWCEIKNERELDSLTQCAKPIEVYNITQVKGITGEVFLLKSKPVPWAWSKNNGKNFMPSKGVKVKIKSVV